MSQIECLHSRSDQELEGDEVCRANFPLPSLAPRLAQACEEVYNGIGAVIIRGLDVDVYTPADLTVIFLGISSYIAEERGIQDRLGTMLSEDAHFRLGQRRLLTL